MATSTSQRVGIWVIAAALTVGTVAGFIAMIIAPQNEAKDNERLQAAYAQYQEDLSEYQDKTEAQQNALEADTAALSKQYVSRMKSYKQKYVKKYDQGEAQKKLVVTDITKGSGATIDDGSTYAAYYVGWLADGTVFDGSIDGNKLKTPLIVRPGGVIQGWSEGVDGMKIGGARMLTIPSSKGYGNSSQGDIPAGSPLKFIVLPIRKLETIKQPEVPQELNGLYG